ncbi:MAG TPA: PQQ-binding-like beta-propeller repeat protein, partial [Verrucomicrobiae bacterium]|nr:PQQ-binding-like beta-propeller repeat protein [Verrucomicrobiae bacterium]
MDTRFKLPGARANPTGNMGQSSNGRDMRWWIPASLVLLAVGSSAYLRFREVPFLEFILLGVGLLTGLLLGLWYIFFTGLPQKKRWVLLLIGGGFLLGVSFGINRWTRVEGSIGGSGIPRLVWKWTPKREGTARPLTINSEPALTNQPAATDASGFPQFLGPGRSGMLSGVALARDWTASPPAALWRQPIGLGWSAFAVSGRYAITQEQRRDDELVVCYELQTGQALWAHTNHVRFSEMLGGDGPRATPTIRRGRVYAMGAAGNLDCLDQTTGRLIWSRDVLNENRLSNLTWGKSCSPLLVNDLVVVTGGEEHENSLLAYDATSGKPVWRAGRDSASYSSPVIATLSGQEQIVIINAHSVAGHDLQHGEMLWEYSWPDTFAKATEPLVVDTNRLFIAAGYGVGCVMLQVERSVAGAWSAMPLWKNRNLKPKFTNLVRRGQFVYGLDDGMLACLNLDTGNREWKEGRYGHGQILLVEDLLIVQAESGAVVLVDISPQKLN